MNLSHLDYEKFRLESFIDWPHEWLSPLELAAEGFYYTGNKDFVRCAFCTGLLGKFRKGDISKELHKHSFPNCSMVRGKATNTSIRLRSILDILPPRKTGIDTGMHVIDNMKPIANTIHNF